MQRSRPPALNLPTKWKEAAIFCFLLMRLHLPLSKIQNIFVQRCFFFLSHERILLLTAEAQIMGFIQDLFS